MSAYEGVGFAVLGAVLFFVLRESKSALAPMVPVIGGIALLLAAFSRFASLEVLGFFTENGIGKNETKTIFKMLSVGFLTEIGADTCDELGASVLAKRLVFLGNIEIFLLAWPILSELLTLSMEMLS
jgi:hypothetical protein